MLDPPGIRQTWHVAPTLLRNSSPRVLPTGNLEPEHAELRPENRPYFDDFTRGPSSIRWKEPEHVLHRKEVLEKIGYVQFSVSF